MRRLLVLLLIISICLSLVACGSGSTAPQTAPEDETPDTAATSDTASSTGTNSSVESLFGVYVLVEGEGDSGFDQTFLEATKLQELPGIKIMVIENDAPDITAHFYYYDEGKRIVYTGLQDGITKISTPYSTVIGIRGNTIVLDGTEWELEGDRIIREGEGYREVYERNDDIDLTKASFEAYTVGN